MSAIQSDTLRKEKEMEEEAKEEDIVCEVWAGWRSGKGGGINEKTRFSEGGLEEADLPVDNEGRYSGAVPAAKEYLLCFKQRPIKSLHFNLPEHLMEEGRWEEEEELWGSGLKLRGNW